VKWVVTYDVADDVVRGRIATALARHGQRVQESVFECVLPDGRALDLLLRRIGEHLTGDPKGQVRIYRVCGACLRESRGVGAVVRTMDSEECVIV
jgi:CRISPR-associated endonuclease Cas2